jgi:hypothetical protein
VSESTENNFIGLAPGANVIILFIAVISFHSMVITSFCVIKVFYLSNHYGMAVNCHDKSFITLVHGGKLKYHCNLL